MAKCYHMWYIKQLIYIILGSNMAKEGTRYNRSTSGWFDRTTFEDTVQNMIVPYFMDLPGGKCLSGDNLSSHLSADLIQTCITHNIDFVFLPANNSPDATTGRGIFSSNEACLEAIIIKMEKDIWSTITHNSKRLFSKTIKIVNWWTSIECFKVYHCWIQENRN